MADRLVLASASPRRRALLESLGVPLLVDASDIPEIVQPGESATQFAQRVARAKAQAMALQYPRQLVLAADTIVVVDDAILGKPANPAAARRMLRRLSGRMHEVMTAVTLVLPSGQLEELIEITQVEFRVLGDTEIETYVDTGEPADKAGAYAIQGGAAGFVTAVHGSFSNVVGLPLEALEPRLRRHLKWLENGRVA